jgi:protein arginine N-methyltransferase 1
MITDRVRVEAYAEALRHFVRPGTVVLDLGAGPGIFSLMACRFGASRVHAVDPDDSIRILAMLAAANGCAEQITIHQLPSAEVKLPRPADLLVSELRGVLPLFEHHIPTIIDARRRLLVPSGRLIPQADRISAALISDPDVYEYSVRPWKVNELDLDLNPVRELVVNSWRRVFLEPRQLATTPQHWATLDYATIESPDVNGGVEWHLERGGTTHGLALWFDAELGDGIGYSTAPGQPKLLYGQAFFPWPEPVELHPGDRVAVELRAVLTGDDYTWRWRSRVTDAAGRTAAAFDQSTFFGAPLAPEELRRREAGFVPELGPEGEVDAFLLAQVDGRTALEEIARRAAARFPERFPQWREALGRAGELAEKYRR